jgi:hypothetical protein
VESAVESVARQWTRAIADTSYVTYTPAETDALLLDHTKQAAAALTGERDAMAAGRSIGVALGRALSAHSSGPRSAAARRAERRP